jgi:transcriptional regulator with XRE-family HTH domain
MQITAQIAKNTRVFRSAARMNQAELADKAGVSQAYIGKIECGRGNVTLNVLSAVADALEVTPAQLITEITFDQTAA